MILLCLMVDLVLRQPVSWNLLVTLRPCLAKVAGEDRKGGPSILTIQNGIERERPRRLLDGLISTSPRIEQIPSPSR